MVNVHALSIVEGRALTQHSLIYFLERKSEGRVG